MFEGFNFLIFPVDGGNLCGCSAKESKESERKGLCQVEVLEHTVALHLSLAGLRYTLSSDIRPHS